MSSKKQTLSDTQAAKMLIQGADKTMKQIEKQGFRGVGKNAAFSPHKKPVCAFGWIAFHAGFLPLVEKHMEEHQKDWSEGITDNNDVLSWAGFGYSGPATGVRAALASLTSANDGDKRAAKDIIVRIGELRDALKDFLKKLAKGAQAKK